MPGPGKTENLIRGRGRPPGAPNKIAADIRAMIEGALNAKGGQKYLEKQAEDNPVAFMGLVGKCLPKDVIIDITNRQVSELSDEQIAERLERVRADRERIRIAAQSAQARIGQKESSEFH